MGRKKCVVFLVIVLIFLAGCSSASASPAASESTLSLLNFLEKFEFFFLISILETFHCCCEFSEIVGGVVTKVVSTIFKRLWALKSTTKTGTFLTQSSHIFKNLPLSLSHCCNSCDLQLFPAAR